MKTLDFSLLSEFLVVTGMNFPIANGPVLLRASIGIQSWKFLLTLAKR
jgi:hypothetical protein